MASPARKTNRLIGETSPYLLQHAHNPVDWYPWGAEALARAEREDKPILLSIGYAACHWCHVMERESFEDEAIAALMNEYFVCIKVDREERPDLDSVYMAATLAMNGQGGWPMTVFLTPDKRPFFAGTYFPPKDAYGRPGFPTLLTRIAEVFHEDRAGVDDQAGKLTQAVRAQLEGSARGEVSPDLLAQAAEQLRASYDPRYGGFGGAPKFPPSAALRLLLRQHARSADHTLLALVRGTLDGMKNGGMYDHVGGGFARYATDERWHVPHFEKMLYDNAQLARVYLEAFQVTNDGEYKRVAEETLDYVLREMQAASGGFYSATDADSEGVEGKFFTFTTAELSAILSEPLLSSFCAYYDVRETGNWEGTNVLWTPRALDEVAEQLGRGVEALREELARARSIVYAKRRERVLDDKVLVSWNALMIGALAEGARILRRPDYARAAERAADFIRGAMVRPDGGLYRTARGPSEAQSVEAGGSAREQKKAHLAAYLEDYAYLGDALIDLYECGSDERYLREAERLCTRMLADFHDPKSGGFFQTAHDHEALIARARAAQDDALPNESAVAALLCARLSVHFDRPAFRSIAEATLTSFGGLLPRAPRAFASMLAVLDFLQDGPVELALVGPPSAREALEAAVGSVYLPNRCIAHSQPGEASNLPLLRDKAGADAGPLAYLCRHFMCEAPLRDPESLREALRGGLTSGRSSA